MAKALEKQRLHMPDTREGWRAWAKHFLGLTLSRKSFEEYAKAPLDIFIDIVTQKYYEYLVMGSRGSGKTALVAGAELVWCHFLRGCLVSHLAAQKDQSDSGYDYVSTNIRRRGFNPFVDNMTQRETMFKNQSKLSIITATLKGVNSFHPHKFVFDELDQLGETGGTSDDNRFRKGSKIFFETLGTACSSTDIIRQQRVYLSSWKNPAHLMSQLLGVLPLDQQVLKPLKKEEIGIMTPLEVMRPCGHLCNEHHCNWDCKTLYNPKRSMTWYDYCQGRAKECDGFVDISMYKEIFSASSEQLWRSQYLCLEPAVENKVFPWFNMLDPQMYGDFPYDPNSELWVGLDFGFRAPNVAILFQKQGEIWTAIHELGMSGKTDQQFGEEFIEFSHQKVGKIPSVAWRDPRADNGGKVLGGILGYKVYPCNFLTGDKKQRMEYVSLLGESGLLRINKDCPTLAKQMTNYRYTTDNQHKVQDGDDDYIDAFVYGLGGAKNRG